MYRYINYGFWSEEVICHQLSYIVSKPWRDNFDPYPKSSIILLIKIIDYINYDLNNFSSFWIFFRSNMKWKLPIINHPIKFIILHQIGQIHSTVNPKMSPNYIIFFPLAFEFIIDVPCKTITNSSNLVLIRT